MRNINMSQALKLLTQAKQEHFSIGAFNAANLETLKAIVGAATALKSPVIIEASPGEADYMGLNKLVALARTFEEDSGIPIILNLDHGKDYDSCKKAIDAGFDYVHIDGSKLPLEENLRETAKLVQYAHARGVIVEGEMDHIEGSSEDHTAESTQDYQNPKLYTDPTKAQAFVETTGIDVFASFIGNLHGVFKDAERLNLDLLKSLNQKLPNTFFSLHGGSGVNDMDLKEAVQYGIVKVNVNTELRIAFKLTLQEALNSTTEIALYKLMEKPILEVQKVVEQKIKLFGSMNKVLSTNV